MEKYDDPTFRLRIQSLWMQGVPIRYKSRNGVSLPVYWTPFPDAASNLEWNDYIYDTMDLESAATGKILKEAQTNAKYALSLTEVLLSERQKTHGDFIDHARVTWRLKQVLKDEEIIMGKNLSPVQTEALEMICHKIGRIFAGNPDFLDHWDDIAGYATLVAKSLRQQKQGEDKNGN